jgi:hypothetical protein
MRPVRVLHLYSGNLFGGVERLLVTLAQYRHFYPARLLASRPGTTAR